MPFRQFCVPLGWNSPEVLEAEYTTSIGGKVDYALLDSDLPLVFIEAKKLVPWMPVARNSCSDTRLPMAFRFLS